MVIFGVFTTVDAMGQRLRQVTEHAEHHIGAAHNHLEHIEDYRKETVYIHNLPPPIFLEGIGESKLEINTDSDKTQRYFNQGLSLLHCFWDFEAYRAFKEAVRHDSTAIMPFWGLYSAIGSTEGNEFKTDREFALQMLKLLKDKATPQEQLYVEALLERESVKPDAKAAYQRKMELLVHRYPDDIEAKLFLALSKMSGYNVDLTPREGQLYSEMLLKDVLKTHPDNAAAHHYWIHLKENCCPEDAIKSAEKLRLLAPGAGHMVHMPGHVYFKLGEYERAHQAFKEALVVDSLYMANQDIPEVDNWNYIHNLNYFLSNSAESGRYETALYYAEKLQKMPVSLERANKYEGRFFYQGIIIPAKMELCFGFYDKAVDRLLAIPDKGYYSKKALAFRDGLLHFASGMKAMKEGDHKSAQIYSEKLDALLWRNTRQWEQENVIPGRRLNDLNVASLELQGLIKNAKGQYDEAITILKSAVVKEKELGYSEPPSYARPVLISLGKVYLDANDFENAEKAFHELLDKRPNSVHGWLGLYLVYCKSGDDFKKKQYAELLNSLPEKFYSEDYLQENGEDFLSEATYKIK